MSRANKLGREVNTLFKQIKTLESQVHPLGSRVENTYNRLRTDRPVTKPILFKHQLDQYEILHKKHSKLTKELSKLHTQLQDKIQAQLNAEGNNLKTSLRRDKKKTTLLQFMQKQLREMDVSMRNTQVLVERKKRKAAKKPSKPISPRTKRRINDAMASALTKFATSKGKSSSKKPKSKKSVFGKGGALRRKSRKVRKSRKSRKN